MPSRAEKLLARMRNSQTGWKPHQIATLLRGFGFEIRHGGRHDVAFHPCFGDLQMPIPRHGTAKPYLARQAVRLVDEAIERTANRK